MRKKMNLNDFSKWLQYNIEWKIEWGSEYFPYPLYMQVQILSVDITGRIYPLGFLSLPLAAILWFFC